MRTRLQLCIIMLSLSILVTNAQQFEWAKSFGGKSLDEASSVATDINGNAYVAGGFRSPDISFGSTTVINTTNDYDKSDIFLIKSDSTGKVLWAKSAGGTWHDWITSIAVDLTGNIYVAGAFESKTITFDTITLTNSFTITNPSSLWGSEDAFIVKYDLNGNVLWAKSYAGSDGYYGSEVISDIATDGFGNIYFTGSFINSTTITFDTITLINSGIDDIFLGKLTPSGNIVWARSAKGSDRDYAKSIAVDENGNICITGTFSSPSFTFDSITLTNVNSGVNVGDFFLAKYNNNGKVLWAKSAQGNKHDEGISLTIDRINNIYVTGCFVSPTIIFDTIVLENNNTSGGCITDFFLVKYDSEGNIIWAKKSTTVDGYGSRGVDVAESFDGCIFVTGIFSGPYIKFDSYTLNNSNSNMTDIFFIKYDYKGTIMWAENVGKGTGWESVNDISADGFNNIYITGYFYSATVSFDTIILSNTTLGLDTSDIFLAKLKNGTGSGIHEIVINKNIKLYPNPSNGLVNLEIKNPSNKSINVEITNINGQVVYNKAFKNNTQRMQIDLGNQSKGMYFVKVMGNNVMKVEKLIVE